MTPRTLASLQSEAPGNPLLSIITDSSTRSKAAAAFGASFDLPDSASDFHAQAQATRVDNFGPFLLSAAEQVGTKAKKRRSKSQTVIEGLDASPLDTRPGPSLSTQLDTSSQCGDQGDIPDLDNDNLHGESSEQQQADRHKEKNRAAQKRFRLRQKARMTDSSQRVEEMERRMEAMALEKQQLETQNRVLLHIVELSSRHIQDTALDVDSHLKHQERILEETSRVYWRGFLDVPPSLDQIKSVTMESFLCAFERYLARFGALLENGAKDPDTAAGRELRQTVLDRRQEEARVALFSDWCSACHAWNKEETLQGVTPPSVNFWTHILDSLELSAEQSQAMLIARRRLLTSVSRISQEREGLILDLGLSLLHQQGGHSASETRLRDSLEKEREAVLDFMYTIVDTVFHPWQEASADLYSHPWHPDLWAFCNILASRCPDEPPDTSASMKPLGRFLPHFSAANFLWTPILSRGAGMLMKRVMVLRKTPRDLLAAAIKPMPTKQRMRNMTIYEIFCGKHLEDTAVANFPALPQGISQPSQNLYSFGD